MVKVTVEIWPGGDPSHSRTVAVGAIGNDGLHPELPRRGSYNASFGVVDKQGVAEPSHVEDFDRSDSVWDLLELALKARHQ